MSSHLTSEQLNQFRSRTLNSAEFLAAASHLEQCTECSGQLYPDERLHHVCTQLSNSIAAADVLHLAYGQMRDYVDRKLSSVDREIVETHVQDCKQCAAELGDLRSFAAHAEPHRPWYSVLAWKFWFAVAASPLAVFLIVMGLRQPAHVVKRQPPPPTNQPPDTKRGLPPEVALALSTGKLTVPAEVQRLLSRPGVLLSGGGAGSTFHIYSPVGTFVDDDHPALRWRPHPNARSYHASVYTESLDPVAESPELSVTQWRVDRALKPGVTYIWQVRASTSEGAILAPGPTEPEARFRVLDAQRRKQMLEELSRVGEEEAAQAVIYARFGLTTKARELLEGKINRDPDGSASRLLESLNAGTRAK